MLEKFNSLFNQALIIFTVVTKHIGFILEMVFEFLEKILGIHFILAAIQVDFLKVFFGGFLESANWPLKFF